MTTIRRHTYALDFSEDELFLSFLPRSAIPVPFESHYRLLSTTFTKNASWSTRFRELVENLRFFLRLQTKLVVLSMVYGEFNRYIPYWIWRARQLHMANWMLLCLDEEAYFSCIEQTHGDYITSCVPLNVSVFNKYSVALIALQLGFDILWLDFDLFLVKNPTEIVYAIAEKHEVDLLIGYGWHSDCVCNGFFFTRSTEVTIEWYKALFRWLYTHPYEHDQRAMSAFLNYTEKTIPRSGEDAPRIPPWNVFDVNTQFINWPDWTGNLSDMVLVHFVDGSAYSLYGRDSSDASRPDEKGGMMDYFYNDEVVPLGTQEPVDPWSTSLKERMMSVRHATVVEKDVCGILPNMKTSYEGYGWIALQGREVSG